MVKKSVIVMVKSVFTWTALFGGEATAVTAQASKVKVPYSNLTL